MIVVRITQPDRWRVPGPVRYSPTGFGLTLYDSDEIYQVDDFTARGLFERGWAEPVNEKDLPALLEARERFDATQRPREEPPTEPKPPPVREPDDEENDDDNGDEPPAAVVRTRKKAR